MNRQAIKMMGLQQERDKILTPLLVHHLLLVSVKQCLNHRGNSTRYDLNSHLKYQRDKVLWNLIVQQNTRLEFHQ